MTWQSMVRTLVMPSLFEGFLLSPNPVGLSTKFAHMYSSSWNSLKCFLTIGIRMDGNVHIFLDMGHVKN